MKTKSQIDDMRNEDGFLPGPPAEVRIFPMENLEWDATGFYSANAEDNPATGEDYVRKSDVEDMMLQAFDGIEDIEKTLADAVENGEKIQACQICVLLDHIRRRMNKAININDARGGY